MSRSIVSASEIESHKGMGRAYKNADRMDKAVETFAGILRVTYKLQRCA